MVAKALLCSYYSVLIVFIIHRYAVERVFWIVVNVLLKCSVWLLGHC